MNPLRDCHLRTHQILRGHTRIFARAYYLRSNNASHVVVGRTIYHAGTKSARPSIVPTPEPHRGLSLIEPLRLYYLGSGRRSRSDGRKLSIPSTSRTQPQGVENHQQTYWQVWTLLPPVPPLGNLHRLTTREERGTQFPGITSPRDWSTRSCSTNGRFHHLRLTVFSDPFRPEEITAALKRLKPRKSPRFHLPGVHTPRRVGSQILFWDFLTSCMRQLKIPKIWKRALIVAIPKPEKPLGDPKTYHPISLLCVPFKILERLIYARVDPIIDPLLLPWEQAGFRHGRSTVDQVTLLAQDSEDSFSAKKGRSCVC